MNFIKQHWKGFVSGVCGVASVAAAIIPGAAPVALVVGVGCTVLTAAHVLDAKDVDRAKELGEGVAGVVEQLEQLEAKGRAK